MANIPEAEVLLVGRIVTSPREQYVYDRNVRTDQVRGHVVTVVSTVGEGGATQVGVDLEDGSAALQVGAGFVGFVRSLSYLQSGEQRPSAALSTRLVRWADQGALNALTAAIRDASATPAAAGA